LQKNLNFVYVKRKITPTLNINHENATLEFAQQYMNYNNNLWSKIIFSDEKKLKASMTFKTSHGRGFVMIWGAFSVYGKTEIAFIEQTLDNVG
jgi:hypothetical protein